ncbi:MaoC family dehydratase [Haladaptatus sp. DJG-WS-42]|uniref:MaoC family dehydratase n=1 Tax=Haladaptatus sp. DJG-WS-42 TaxID=3120516 RepID=UPI0030CCBF34
MIPASFEEFEPGQTFAFGSYTLTEADIVDFATEYDPQPFHVDAAAAEDTMFGGLIASGWQTCSVTMRLLVDNFMNKTASLGAAGVDELRWLRPVRPGDTLSVRIEVLETSPAETDPTRGDVYYEISTYNQDDEKVLSMKALGMIGRES